MIYKTGQVVWCDLEKYRGKTAVVIIINKLKNGEYLAVNTTTRKSALDCNRYNSRVLVNGFKKQFVAKADNVLIVKENQLKDIQGELDLETYRKVLRGIKNAKAGVEYFEKKGIKPPHLDREKDLLKKINVKGVK